VIAVGNQQFTTAYGRAFYEKEFNAAFVLMEYFATCNATRMRPDTGTGSTNSTSTETSTMPRW
jgi:hypothetical protein